MIYTESPEEATALINSIDDALTKERRDKTDSRFHVSDAVYCLRKGWRRRKLSTEGVVQPKESENHRLILIIGQALHVIHSKAAGGRVANTRLETPWLVGEADASIRKDRKGEWVAIEEFKTARAGMQQDDPQHWPHYVEQVGTYLVLAREMGHKINQGLLQVMHMTFAPGVKKRKAETWDEFLVRKAQYEADNPEQSHLRAWPMNYSDDELDRWKDELHRRVDILEGPDEPSVYENAPADKSGFSWECGYCPFFVKNGGDCEGGPGRPANFFPIDREDADEFST